MIRVCHLYNFIALQMLFQSRMVALEVDSLVPSSLMTSHALAMKRTYWTVPMTLSVTVTTQRMLESSVVQSVSMELFVLQ